MDKVYCSKCKYYVPASFEGLGSPEYCGSMPRDTYLAPNRDFDKPFFKNKENDCSEFEVKA